MNPEKHQNKKLVGQNRIIGHEHLREQMWNILVEGRISHAYLISGQSGAGKKALALAFAEAINGVANLGDPGPGVQSVRRSWYYHPDIHVFLPLPSNVTKDELRARVALLSDDPYAMVDFSIRPSLTGQEDSKNRSAFYSVAYFNTEIRRIASRMPNEGKRSVIIISNIEKMQDRVVNSFLKLLEEPGENITFILTTDSINSLLPTVISRCQLLTCQMLHPDQIYEGLKRFDSVPDEEARFLSRIAGGNYSFTRFYNLETLRENREDIIQFLRMSYTVDAEGILDMSQKWQAEYNKEGQFAIINMIEVFLRDIALYSATADESLITNIDRLDVIKKFCSSLKDARIEEMIASLEESRNLLAQNIQPRLLFTVLANRFAAWMRGADTVIGPDEEWRHIPAITQL